MNEKRVFELFYRYEAILLRALEEDRKKDEGDEEENEGLPEGAGRLEPRGP